MRRTPQRTEKSPGPSAPKNQKTLGTLPFKSSKPYDQHAIDLQIAPTIIATNMSFNSGNNPQLKNLVTMLKPNTAVLDRREVAEPLLVKISDMENAKVKGVISGMQYMRQLQ